jgi:hypothetical protein
MGKRFPSSADWVPREESIPNSGKLFSIFEPHTQLYKRGKAGEPIQFGRLLLIYEDAAGFIPHYHRLARDRLTRRLRSSKHEFYKRVREGA